MQDRDPQSPPAALHLVFNIRGLFSIIPTLSHIEMQDGGPQSPPPASNWHRYAKPARFLGKGKGDCHITWLKPLPGRWVLAGISQNGKLAHWSGWGTCHSAIHDILYSYQAPIIEAMYMYINMDNRKDLSTLNFTKTLNLLPKKKFQPSICLHLLLTLLMVHATLYQAHNWEQQSSCLKKGKDHQHQVHFYCEGNL